MEASSKDKECSMNESYHREAELVENEIQELLIPDVNNNAPPETHNAMRALKKQLVSVTFERKCNVILNSEFDRMRVDMLDKIKLLEDEMRDEVQRKYNNEEISTQTGDCLKTCAKNRLERLDVGTQTYYEDTCLQNIVLLKLDSKLEKLKTFIVEKIDDLHDTLNDQIMRTVSRDCKISRDRLKSSLNSGAVPVSELDVNKTVFRDNVPTRQSFDLMPHIDSIPRVGNRDYLSRLDQLIKPDHVIKIETKSKYDTHVLKPVQSNFISCNNTRSAFKKCVPTSVEQTGNKTTNRDPLLLFTTDDVTKQDPFLLFTSDTDRIIQSYREELARKLVDELFLYEDLAHSNVTGVKGKRLLDPAKIQVIRNTVFRRFPIRNGEKREDLWNIICEKINTKCRGVTRTLKRKSVNYYNDGGQVELLNKSRDNKYQRIVLPCTSPVSIPDMALCQAKSVSESIDRANQESPDSVLSNNSNSVGSTAISPVINLDGDVNSTATTPLDITRQGIDVIDVDVQDERKIDVGNGCYKPTKSQFGVVCVPSVADRIYDGDHQTVLVRTEAKTTDNNSGNKVNSSYESDSQIDHTPTDYTYTPSGDKNIQYNREDLTRSLIESMFTRSTLANSNVTGARGKFMLDPIKISKVRETVFSHYPAINTDDEDVIWRGLTTKINTKCRGVKRLMKRNGLLLTSCSEDEYQYRRITENGHTATPFVKSIQDHPVEVCKSIEPTRREYVSMVNDPQKKYISYTNDRYPSKDFSHENKNRDLGTMNNSREALV